MTKGTGHEALPRLRRDVPATTKLKSFDHAERFLKPGVTFEQLDATAHAVSDFDAAHAINDARDALFRAIGYAWNAA